MPSSSLVFEREQRSHVEFIDPDVTAELVDADEGSGIALAQSAMEAIMSTNIADEVADAVRRALAAIDAVAEPEPQLSPDDFLASSSQQSPSS
jgi:hypothetical protein